MKAVCNDCLTEITTEGRADRCLKCGSLDITLVQGEIVQPGASQEAEEGNNTLPAVRQLLLRLCEHTYDVSYQGSEWEQLIDGALKELRPFLKAA